MHYNYNFLKNKYDDNLKYQSKKIKLLTTDLLALTVAFPKNSDIKNLKYFRKYFGTFGGIP